MLPASGVRSLSGWRGYRLSFFQIRGVAGTLPRKLRGRKPVEMNRFFLAEVRPSCGLEAARQGASPHGVLIGKGKTFAKRHSTTGCLCVCVGMPFFMDPAVISNGS